jgi:hypothetical protein
VLAVSSPPHPAVNNAVTDNNTNDPLRVINFNLISDYGFRVLNECSKITLYLIKQTIHLHFFAFLSEFCDFDLFEL